MEGEEAVEDKEVATDKIVVKSTLSRVLRGGSFRFQASYVRSASRPYDVPTNRDYDFGFRLVRTFIP